MSLHLQRLYRWPVHHHGPKLLELFFSTSLLATCLIYAYVLYLITQSCPTSCVPLDCSPPGSNCITITIVTQSALTLRSATQKVNSFPLTFKCIWPSHTFFWPSQTYELINHLFVFHISVLSFIVISPYPAQFLSFIVTDILLEYRVYFSSVVLQQNLTLYLCHYLLHWAWLRKINSARENQPIMKNGASITDKNPKWAVNSVTTATNSL